MNDVRQNIPFLKIFIITKFQEYIKYDKPMKLNKKLSCLHFRYINILNDTINN